MTQRIYSLYKGDNYIIDGTKQEIADYLGIKIKSLNFYLTPTYAKRGKSENANRKKLIYLGKF